MLLHMLLACTPDGPNLHAGLATMTTRVTPAEIDQAIAIAATHQVTPSSPHDLGGTWAIERVSIGDDEYMDGPVQRRMERPGITSFGVVAQYSRGDTPYAHIASRGLEVVGTDKLCILWLESRLTWSDGSKAALDKQAWTDLGAMNATPCADAIESLSPTAATFRRGAFVYTERKLP